MNQNKNNKRHGHQHKRGAATKHNGPQHTGTGNFKNKQFGMKKKPGAMGGAFTDQQKGIMRHYHRVLKKEQRRTAAGSDGGKGSSRITHSIAENKKRMKLTAYQRAQLALEAKEAERRQRREEEERQARERQAALKQYRKKKFERLHKLSKKTSKGQPVMKGRIEVLLEKIQSSMGRGE